MEPNIVLVAQSKADIELFTQVLVKADSIKLITPGEITSKINLATKYYTADLLIRPILFDTQEKTSAAIQCLEHKECVIFIANLSSPETYVKACLAINESLDTDITLLFYSKSGKATQDDEYEGRLNKLLYDNEGEKVVEQVSDYLDVSSKPITASPLISGEERTGMPRVVEALECNMWPNMVKIQPKIAKEVKKGEEEKEKFDPNKDYEKEMDEFETLMAELLKVKEQNKDATMEEKHKNAETVMWRFARMFGIGEKEEDPYEVAEALKELERGDIKKKSGEEPKKQ